MAENVKRVHTSGTILRGEDGSVYFIRDELLEACRLSGEELQLAERSLQSAKRSPMIRDAEVVRLEREMPALDFKNIQIDGGVASTVMCCW